MIHGPCGEYNLNLPCMNNDKRICSKQFPKPFNDNTIFNTNGYPIYRRRNDGKKIIFKNKKIYVDNRSVVPYNPYSILIIKIQLSH